MKIIILPILILATSLFIVTVPASGQNLPNIVVMLADDMGFGEVQCLNRDRGKIKTPQLDQLATAGMIFTDAHSGSSVCTPTRYGLMTGRYAWRTRLQRGVLTGGESLIDANRLTLAKMLHDKGYHTAMMGKWHLGMLYDGEKNSGKIEVGAKITHGPIDRGGFDTFYGFHHSRQMNLWIENNIVVKHLEPVEMLPRLTEKAVEYIGGRKDKDQPFFLYVPWNSPHAPVVPSNDWKGQSGLNDHADFVMQTDDSYGRVIQALKENGLFENTLIICSTDNGTSAPTSKMAQLIKLGHHSSADLRGSKSDIWDGGHRVPFIVSWPALVAAGRRNDALVCLTDIMATVAELIGYDLPDDAGEDSISFVNVLRAKGKPSRANVVHHSVEGQFALRDGQWKLICCPGSGGWSKPGTKVALKRAQEEKLPISQLYDMRQDKGEQNNLAGEMPGKVESMRQLLNRQIELGRSTPGVTQKNDATIVVDKWKNMPPKRKKQKSKKQKEG